MNLKEYIKSLADLGSFLRGDSRIISSNTINKIEIQNPWFSKQNILYSLKFWSLQLTYDKLHNWISNYSSTGMSAKTILLVIPSNIPLVGFHDFLCILLSGNNTVIKMSSKNNILLPWVLDKLCEINPDIEKRFIYINSVKNIKCDALIASGSDNTARYFNYIFKGTQRIIRKNRKSIAILSGKESMQELQNLCDDIFLYFGLGCRNVSFLFFPLNYDINKLTKVFSCYKQIIDHKKYRNNLFYYRNLFAIENIKFINTPYVILKEHKNLGAPLSVLYYSYYQDKKEIKRFIKNNKEQIQCIVSNQKNLFGTAQKPELSDYADGIDTIEFLNRI